MKVAVYSYGLSTSAGNKGQTWDRLMTYRPTFTEWMCPDGVARNVHVQGESGSDIYSLAMEAIDEAMDSLPGSWFPETLCVGSSSDTMRERELAGPLPHPVLQLYVRLGGVYPFAKKHQVSTACASSSYAIAIAMDLIRQHKAESVLAGGSDEVPMSAIGGFSSWRVYADVCRPFAADRHGLVLGEGAAFMYLAAPGASDMYGKVAKPIAYLTGVGLVSDAKNTADMDTEAVARAINYALDEAGIDEVDAVFAHGTGTIANDKSESEAIWQTFGPNTLPHVLSYKGILGHTQGASGAINVALAIKALEEQKLFPTISSTLLDPSLDVYGSVTTHPINAHLDRILCLSHGSWGTYSAIIVEKP